ncbi:MAG: 16S rRNA (guanine(527)-N(7))-methyltransferase RsmG [Chloroflexota bacterium]
MPSAYLDALASASDALDEVGVHLDGDMRTALSTHVRLMLAWNEAINLTAIIDPAAIARRHIVDSLAAVPVLRDGPSDRLVDIGSGAGFPGLPLAVVQPWQVALADSVGKKAAFLRTAVAVMGLEDRVSVRNARAETLERGMWDIVTARAVGSLSDLVEIGLPLLRPGGRLIIWKRGDLTDEFAAARRASRAMGGSDPRWHPHPEAVTRAADLGGHGVVVVARVGASPTEYPRDPATRKRRPW